MNRITVALLAAFDAALSALIGIAIPLVPLTVLWAVQYDTAIDWGVFWRIAADSWLLGHGADLRASLAPDSPLALALPGGTEAFTVTIAPLAFALLTVLLGARTGRRAQESPFRFIGFVVAVGTYLLLAFLVSVGSSTGVASIDVVQGTVLPALVFALGVALGAVTPRRGAASPTGWASSPARRSTGCPLPGRRWCSRRCGAGRSRRPP
ncbi:DUF6350 family protein [Rathayibacter oskolensis]|uniref:cell division protein PerM n=1 Tax=Rathayibacter oskolensis TaxID=1891671 RepID=UPI00265F0CD6|nr:DUF6350 family protein [Rathayibacter oskolensis]WKK71977.1 DUF6350 family protein [Rathayibacter oskolensis]